MPSQQSPFVHKTLACPACYAKTAHRFFRRHVFVVEETEPDQHALRYRWAGDHVQRVNPLYYALFFCPHCFYADVAEDFGKPFETEARAATLKAFKKAGPDDTLLQLVGQHIDYDDLDSDAALRLHFMAVLIHSRIEEELQDAYKLARLYLRIAWLYREQEHGLPAGLEAGAASVAQTVPPAHDPGRAPQLLAAAEAMQKAQRQFDPHWRALEHLIQQRADELARTAPGNWHNPYPLCLEPLMSAYEQLGEGLHALCDLAFRDASGLLHEPGERGAPDIAPDKAQDQAEARSRRRARFLPHATFMERLATLWERVPRTEQEALVLALEAFRRALANDLRLENPQSRLKVSSLVVELQMRQGDFRGALEVTRGLHRLAMASRQNLQARLREEDVTDSEARRIQNLMQKATATLESAADLREDVIRRMVKAESPRIRNAFAALPARAKLKDFEAVLAAQGFAKEIIMYLKKRNMQLPA